MHSAAIPCQRLPHVRPSDRRAICTRHPLRLPTNERETPSCALRVGNAHDTFMHSNKHASLAIYRVPGLHINSSVASGACDCSVFQRPAKCKKQNNKQNLKTATRTRRRRRRRRTTTTRLRHDKNNGSHTCKRPITRKQLRV